MPKPRPRCKNCVDPIVNCGDCDAQSITLNWQEAQDCISAIGVWVKALREREPKSRTIKDLERLTKKLWKLKSTRRGPA